MVRISYKAPFLDMLNGWPTWTGTEGREILGEIARDVSIDAENCDTPYQTLAGIAHFARRASKRGGPQYASSMVEIIRRFMSLDDSNIPCEVEASSPLAW